MPLVETAPHWECEMCGLATGWVDNDLVEGDEEIGVPPGWVRLDARIAVPNPELARHRQSVDEAIASMAAGLASGEEVQAVHLSTARNLIEAQALEAPPPHYIEEISYCYCHSCKPYLANVEITDFGTPPETPVEPPANTVIEGS